MGVDPNTSFYATRLFGLIYVYHCRVRDLLQSLGRPADAIPESEIDIFCKNTFSIRLVRSRPLEDEFTKPKSEVIAEGISDFMEGPPEMCPMVWYLGLR